ncbi:antitoxin VbhA family protein [Neobacillus sp. K501]
MTKPNEETIEKALRNTQASMELSGFTITEEHREIVRLKLTGEISEEEFFKLVLKRVTGK